MKKKLICLTLAFALATPCYAMNQSGLLEEEQKIERVRPRVSSVAQNGLIFLGSTALTVTSGLCYSKDYPETSMLMTFGWGSISLGTGWKFINSLKDYWR